MAQEFISASVLKSIVLNLTIDRAGLLARYLNEILPRYQLNRADRFHEFIAQLAHESDGMTAKSENMNYSAQRMAEVWPSRYAAIQRKPYTPNDKAKRLQRNPEAIANDVYANRMGNGSPESGDGWAFRGGGYIQMTGRDMYERYYSFLKRTAPEAVGGIKDAKSLAEMVRSDEWFALDSACWVFAIEKQLLDEADRDDFLLITKRINGGTLGLEDRTRYYDRAKKAMPI